MEYNGEERSPLLVSNTGVTLLIIDVQEKFGPAIPEINDVVKNICVLSKAFEIFKLPIVITEQYPKGLGKTIKDIIDCSPNAEYIEKITFSCAQSSEFMSNRHISSSKKIVVCGVETHVCVHQTVLDLVDKGYQVYVVSDAVNSRKTENKQLALKRMEQAGALITSTEMLLFEMLYRADSSNFKEIQKLIK